MLVLRGDLGRRDGWTATDRTPRIQYLRGPITMEEGDAIIDRGAFSLVSFGDGWKRR